MRSGDIIAHKIYGTGKILELRKAGLEVKVGFHSGFVLICAIRDLISVRYDNGSDLPAELPRANPPARPPITSTRDHVVAFSKPPAVPAITKKTLKMPIISEVEGDEQFLAKQTIEALRLGVVPHTKVDELTAGLASERADLKNAFLGVDGHNGEVRAVIGEYGSGKSHLFEWTSLEALRRGYLVARTNLDVLEVQPNKPQKIYNALIRSLKYPDRTDGGSLGPLFDQILDGDGYSRIVKSMAGKHDRCPLLDAIYSYGKALKSHDTHGASVILDWIAGEKVFASQVRDAARGSYMRISTTMNAADQYCYLLSGISWVAKQVGYQGLAVLIDEAEHLRMLSHNYRYYAETFFRGMIYSALGDRQSKIEGCGAVHGYSCGLSHGSQTRYPFRYSKDCNLLFMFATTPASNEAEYTCWLDKAKIIYLQDKLQERDIESLLAQIYVFHRKAYSYDRKEDYADAGTKLINCYEAGSINLRELIKLSTEVFDLLSAYPDYSRARINQEIDDAFAVAVTRN